MKKYIYWNDKECHFFEAENDLEARHYVINHYDLSHNPEFMEVLEKTEDRFKVKGVLKVLTLGKHFKVAWVGKSLVCFKIKNQ